MKGTLRWHVSNRRISDLAGHRVNAWQDGPGGRQRDKRSFSSLETRVNVVQGSPHGVYPLVLQVL